MTKKKASKKKASRKKYPDLLSGKFCLAAQEPDGVLLVLDSELGWQPSPPAAPAVFEGKDHAYTAFNALPVKPNAPIIAKKLSDFYAQDFRFVTGDGEGETEKLLTTLALKGEAQSLKDAIKERLREKYDVLISDAVLSLKKQSEEHKREMAERQRAYNQRVKIGRLEAAKAAKARKAFLASMKKLGA